MATNEIISNDSIINSAISQLIDFVNNNGGYVHPDLIVIVENGNLSAHMRHASTSTPFMILHVPDNCLPSADDFTFELDENNTITILEKKASATDTAATGMQLTIDLFNLTNKIELHKKSSLSLYLYNHHKDIFNLLNDMHIPSAPPVSDENSRVLKSFFSSRTMGYATAAGTYRNNVFLPVIDWLNHSNNGLPSNAFEIPPNFHPGISIFYTKSANNDECLFQYSYMDPLTCAFFFSFTEPAQTHLRSVPLTISLPRNTLHISRRKNMSSADQIPEAAKDLGLYFPAMVIDEGQPSLSQLIIPSSKAPRSMRRILEIAIRNLSPEISSRQEMEELIQLAENSVILSNEQFFTSLLKSAELIEHTHFNQIMVAMIKQSLKIISDYVGFTKNLPFSYLPYKTQ